MVLLPGTWSTLKKKCKKLCKFWHHSTRKLASYRPTTLSRLSVIFQCSGSWINAIFYSYLKQALHVKSSVLMMNIFLWIWKSLDLWLTNDIHVGTWCNTYYLKKQTNCIQILDQAVCISLRKCKNPFILPQLWVNCWADWAL